MTCRINLNPISDQIGSVLKKESKVETDRCIAYASLTKKKGIFQDGESAKGNPSRLIQLQMVVGCGPGYFHISCGMYWSVVQVHKLEKNFISLECK